MSFTPWFPEAGTYIRYFDFDRKEYRYRRLLWRRDPFTYPYRFASVAAGAGASMKAFDELNPSETKKHIYLAYLGVKPGFLFRLWHPYDIRNLMWDEDVTTIDEDLTGCLTYESSPYEYPTKSMGIEHDRYPGVEPKKNISGEAKNPEVIFIGSVYVVREHHELSQDELARLQAGTLRSYPWEMGGEI